MYKIGDNNLLSTEKKSTKYYYLIGGLVWLIAGLMLTIVITYFNYFTFLKSNINNSCLLFFIIFCIIGGVVFCLSGFIISIIFTFTRPKKEEKELVKYVEITPDGLIFEYFDGHNEKHPYAELLDDAIMTVGFTNALGEKIYHSMAEFFEDAYDFINETINRYKGKKKVYPVINPLKNGKNIFVLIVSPDVLDLKKFLEDWRENYEAYLKRIGRYGEYKKQYEEIKRIKEIKKKKEPKMARIYFFALLTIVILSVISFIFLSLIPYLTTSPSSPNYSDVVAYLMVDAPLTIILVIIGIIKLPKLWDKGWKKLSKRR